MKYGKRILTVLALACAALVLTLTACSSSSSSSSASGSASNSASNAEPTHVVIGTLATEDILPYWVAESEGLFKEAGIDAQITVFQSATELIAGVTSGAVDAAMTDHMVTASIYASGTDVQTKWITLGATPQQGRFGIMTADPSITSLADLAGVPVGVGSNTILEYVMDTLMLNAGLTADQIVTEELQKLPVRYQACVSNQVKAAALPGSLLALGESAGCKVVADDTTGENISQSVMIFRTEALEKMGEAGEKALEEVWNKAVGEINAAPESYRALLVEKANLSETIADTYPISEYPTCQMPTQTMVDNVLTWMKGKGYLAEGITYDAATGNFSGR